MLMLGMMYDDVMLPMFLKVIREYMNEKVAV